jgi:hypothetical protein
MGAPCHPRVLRHGSVLDPRRPSPEANMDPAKAQQGPTRNRQPGDISAPARQEADHQFRLADNGYPQHGIDKYAPLPRLLAYGL